MKKYVLKDKVLYDWLCENSENFNKEFQKACAQGFENNWDFICLSFLINKNSVLTRDELDLAFKKTAIEFEEVYDPNAWNDYPAITPPEYVLMRVEREWCRTCAIFEQGKWRSEENGKAAIDSNGYYDNTFYDVKRFRPWED